MTFDTILFTFAFLALLSSSYFLLKTRRDFKRNEAIADQIGERYRSEVVAMMITNFSITILVKDGIWLDAGYIDEYMRNREVEVDWIREGF